MIRRSVEIPVFLKLRAGAMREARAIVESHAPALSKPLIVTDQHSESLATDLVGAQWDACEQWCIDSNSVEECERIIHHRQFGFVIAIGGGRALDMGKYAARLAGRSFVAMPTQPSHDGIASPVAVLKDEHGVSQSLSAVMPIGVIADLTILAEAPVESVAAGTGDLLSNLSAIEDWLLAERETGEKVDDYALLLSEQSANLILRHLEANGSISDSGYIKLLVEGLILSGIAMNIAGSSRPASGSEHEFSHAIDSCFPARAARHGFQVAFGTLLAEKLRGKDIEGFKKIFASAGLPTTVAQLGLTLEEAVTALEAAPGTRPGRYTILEHRCLTKQQCRALIESI